MIFVHSTIRIKMWGSITPYLMAFYSKCNLIYRELDVACQVHKNMWVQLKIS